MSIFEMYSKGGAYNAIHKNLVVKIYQLTKF
jgi:hypothetical protein